MLDDIVEIVEEAPIFVLGLVVGIILLSVGGSLGYGYITGAYAAPAPTPQIIYVTPAPTAHPTDKPVITPQPTSKPIIESITDKNNIPGATFIRTANDPQGVYYGEYYREKAVYIDVERWYAGGGRVVQHNGDLQGLTVYTRFGMSVTSRYDESKNILNSLLDEPFKLYLDMERRGVKT